VRVGNTNGRRVTADYPARRDAADILRGAAPTPGGEWLRQTEFRAFPDFGGVIVLTFISRLELADASASDFQAIADRFLAIKGPRDVLLTLNDVAAGFRVTVDAATTIADLAHAANSDPKLIQQKIASLGWIGGWHRTFQKDGLAAEQITDASSVYGSTDGARQALAENIQVATSGPNPRLQIPLGGTLIGDEAVAYQIDSSSGNNQYTTIVIYFRVATFSNTVTLRTNRGLAELTRVIALANATHDRAVGRH